MRRRTFIVLGAAGVLAAGLAIGLALRGRARIAGTVLLPAGGPAANVQVRAELHPRGGNGTVVSIPILLPREWTAVTDAAGRYEMSRVRTDGEVRIGPSVPGWGVVATTAIPDLAPGETRRLDFTLPTVTRPAPPK